MVRLLAYSNHCLLGEVVAGSCLMTSLLVFRIYDGLQMDHRTHCVPQHPHTGPHDERVLLSFCRVFVAVGTQVEHPEHQGPHR